MSIHRRVLQFFSVTVILSMMFSSVHVIPTAAQEGDGVERQYNAQTGKISFIGPESGSSVSAAGALGTMLRPQDPAMALAKQYGPEFGLKNPERDLVEMKTQPGEGGRLIVRYQQQYEGIPVMAGELNVNTNENGDLYSMNGEVSTDLSLSTTPSIAAEQAVQTALNGAAEWYEKAPEDFIASTPELWIYDESLLRPSTRMAELVWRLEVTPRDASMPVRELVLVNAQRGNISLHFNQVDTAWTLSGKTGVVQDTEPTPTPQPTETPFPIETSEPVPPITPTPAGTEVDEEIPGSVRSGVTALIDTTLYVATTGNNSNSCATADAPCATINGAIAKAGTDAVIKVANGTYTDTTGNTVLISKGLTLSGGWNNAFTVQDGASIIDGGGVRNGILANATGSIVVVENFIVQNSYTVNDSGGIYIYGANFTLKNSAVINNRAINKGAGIFLINNASLTVLNSTISGNTANTSGGGIYAVNGTVTINNSTIAYNTSKGTGGGLSRESATVSIRNSILAKNTAATNGADCFGVISSSDHTILGNTAGCTVTSGPGDLFNVDPLIESTLTGTRPLHALQADSPAINAGDTATCLTTDQRGMPRPNGSACDIGAYEHPMASGLFAISGSNQTTRPGTAFAQPFEAYLLDSSAQPIVGAVVTFTAPASGPSGIFSDSGTRVTTAVTDSYGYAISSVFTANNQGGSYTVSATADGYDNAADFHLTNSLADLYVAPDGSDANTCSSPTAPCQTINAAITKAVPGNTIAIANGTYTGTGSYVVYINKALTLLGGWESDFSQQTGWSVIDGQNARTGVGVFNVNNNNIGSTIDRFKITNGYSSNSAGGINVHVPLILNNSIVIRNRTSGGSSGSAGGIFASADLTLNNSTIQENTSTNKAGGILIHVSDKLTVNNSTITGNQAVGGYGGGILLSGGSSASPQITNIFNSTIVNNSAKYGGGIDIETRSPGRIVLIRNSIIANNTAVTGPDCKGIVTELDHSLIANTTECTVSTGIGNSLNVNPLVSLYPIGVWGYHSLHVDSPARDTGADCLGSDQRGISRPQGAACDMGAFESYAGAGAPASFGDASGSYQKAPTTLPFSNPLAVYVIDNDGNPVSGAVVNFVAPATGASGTFADTGTNTTTISTDSTGLAIAPVFTANAELGTYSVVATVSGLSGSIEFVLTNKDFFVSPTGNDTNTCDSPASTCLTIGAAITKASNGDVIKIASGTYTTSIGSQVVSLTKSLTLSGGWNSTFSSQNGYSVIDGQGTRIGIQNTSASSTLKRFIIQNGYTTSSGAGIHHTLGTLTIDQSLIHNNRASSSGGGIFAEGNLIINNSTIRNNSALRGGAIAISLSTNSLTLNNSTLTGNQATDAGGAIVLYVSYDGGSPGPILIQNSTIVNNSAQSSGGGFYTYSGSLRPVNITNSILARNTAKTSGPNCYGVINIFDHSLIDNSANCTLANGTGNILNTDPLLSTYPVGLLGLHALQPASPAMDAGVNCLSTDQRGVSRPQGIACDMGSYESITPGAPAYFGVAAGTTQRAGQLFPFALPLVVYVVDSAGSPVSGVEVTFTAPASGASGTFAGSGTNTAVVSTTSEGLAFSPVFTANTELGMYNVVATVAGLADAVNFSLTNATWFVAITGNDGNSCSTPAAPCLTINGAINKALPGDVIKVATGVYAGYTVNISKSVTLSGGWNSSFSMQDGFSVIDGSSGLYDGMSISGANVSVSRFVIRKGYYGILHSGGTLRFEQGALIANRTGIYNTDGDTTFINTTISGSTGGGVAGGAISNVRGVMTIQFSTITNNGGSYAIYNANGYAHLKIGNSILAGNTSADCFIGSNTNISEGNNIFGRSPACSGSGIVVQPTDLTGTNPKLLPLVAGSYHPILPGGPAYEAAKSSGCPATDQRGVPRPVGNKCDIGAIEFRANGTIPASLIALGGMGQSMPLGKPASARLTAVVLDANGDGVSGVAVTFTGPVNGAGVVFATTGTYTAEVITDVNGIATSPAFTANNALGSYTVAATAAGLTPPTLFALFNGSYKVRTYTANNGTSLPGMLLCDQTRSNCTNGIDPHADAAHRYAIGTYEFYMFQHQRNSIDNHNLTILSTVHYSSGYANAFWNEQQMVYGDAHGFPLADDVVAHELTHGVTQYESNLFYYYQSGAINESFSDLWGEYYDQSNGQGNDTAAAKWLMGEDVSGLGALRSMSNPPAHGDPDRMSSNYYYEGASDNGGVHTNSGVNNKAVYLMVEGGTFNNITVAGIGWEKAAAIYYEVNTNLLSSGSDYSDLYYALQQACTNLIGQKGITADDCVAVKNAVDAVEMNGQPAPNFNTDAPICDPDTSVVGLFSDGFESGTGNWTFNNGSNIRWQVDSHLGRNAHSGIHSLYADDYPAVITDAKAQLKSMVIPSRAYLRFAQAYDFQASTYNYDGGVLEYSIDGGSTWMDAGPLMDFNGYKGTIYTGNNNPLQGRSAFVGTSHGYISTRLNLAPLAGKTVSFRWRMGLDASGYSWGWWVDDVTLYRCMPADAASPTVSSITRVDPDMTQAASVNFTVTFSEPVSGVDTKDFTLTTTGVTGAAITDVSGSGTTYTVTVNTGTGNGTIRLDVKDDDSIVDAANNPLGDYGVGNGDFITGEKYTILKSAVKPGTPILLSPAAGALITSLQPLLDWKDAAPLAHHYQIQISTNNTFTASTVDDATISDSEFIPSSALVPGKLYYWRVRALNIANDTSAWSAVRTFKTPLETPILTSPANVQLLNNDRPAFDWVDVPGASQYILQVSASSTFDVLLLDTTINVSRHDTTRDLPQNKLLYWRVRAKTSAVTSPWSAKWSFKTGNPPSVPVLVAPAHNALVKDYTPLLDWNNSTLPSGTALKHYQLEVDDDPDFSSPVIATIQPDSKFTPSLDLAANEQYYWRVGAVNKNDHISGWSTVWSFRTVIQVPQSLSMIPTTNPLRPSFDWDDAVGLGITGYTIQISTSASFSTLLVNSTLMDSHYTMIKDLPSNKMIYWRVRVNGTNGPSAWSITQFSTP